MIVPLGSIVTLNELAAWQSRLPKNRRYSVHGLLELYKEPIEIDAWGENYIELQPKRRGR